MDFQLTEAQQALRRRVRRLVGERIAPRAAEIDRTGEYPWDLVKLLGEEGLFGVNVPRAYGGSGAGAVALCLAIEEVARGCASTAAILMASALTATPILLAGTEEQKRRYLPPLARGERGGAFALTEPQAGSDAAAIRTAAVRRGGDYVLNGHKRFIGNAGPAEIYVILARTGPAPGTRGITAFIVEKGTPGFTIGRAEEKLGLRGTVTSALHVEECRIPEAQRLGDEGEGFRLAMRTLDLSRPAVGAQAVGIAAAAYEAALAYARERVQFGRPLSEFQAIQFKLADMVAGIRAARLLVYEAAAREDRGAERITLEAAVAKLFATEMATRVVHQAMQVLGGYGYVRDYPLERLYRDVRIGEIYEGTSEIMRLIIAREALRGDGLAQGAPEFPGGSPAV